MSQTDYFAEIALQQHPISKDEMAEIGAPAPCNKYFIRSNEKAACINQKSYEENLKDFKNELLCLKEKYKKFMRDNTPAKQIERKQWYQNEFQFRYEEEQDKKDFNRVLNGKGEWEQVTIPDYRGPVGRWAGFYRREFRYPEPYKPGKSVFICFEGVDYIANVYINNRFVGSHEGFFAPFEFDITDYLVYEGQNVLVVEVKNDATTKGIEDCGPKIDGDKIYAATGPGWDDPVLGWHHCPPGAGIYNKVFVEERPRLFVQSIFVRPDIDQSSFEAWVEVYNTDFSNEDLEIKLSVYPRNFEGKSILNIPCKAEPAGPGINYYRFSVPLDEFRLWTPEEPWLYTLRAALYEGGRLLDERDCQFGMRKFHMDEEGELKGTLYLNNKPVILRGANDMGHMQQCVMKEDFEQLIDDILIGKLANMNFYRFTQRPVQREIYEYCDMLGMMNQTDLPLFGFLRRNKFTEAIKQAGEMEKLIRSHPSAIMVSYINEPSNMQKWGKRRGHRDLFRNELEDFFESATKVVHIENPDRVVKNVDGDYDPPTRTGLSDFHCYCMWYTNHTIPIGRLHKGYLPAMKKGWKTGCGEYGAEGLDPVEIMMEDYPKEWVPGSPDEPWSPRKIIKAQTFAMHGDWYEEQYTMNDWIRESQRHQAEATRFLTDAFRRRADYIVSTAIHLLIDAWPSGWMKTLVDYRRKPKPAYFEFKKSLEPIRVNLRTDRFTMYSGEEVCVEAWTLNDTPQKLENCRIVATIRKEGEDIESFELPVEIKPANAECAGIIRFKAPAADDREVFYVDASVVDRNNRVINSERLALEAFARKAGAKGINVLIFGDKEKDVFKKLDINIVDINIIDDVGINVDSVIVVPEYDIDACRDKLMDMASKGANVFIMTGDDKESMNWDDITITFKGAAGGMTGGLTFVARNPEEAVTADFKPKDFYMWYNEEKDHIDYIALKCMECESLRPLIFTYKKPRSFENYGDAKSKLPVVGYVPYGKGRIIFSSINIKGFIGKNPILDRFLLKMLDPKCWAAVK